MKKLKSKHTGIIGELLITDKYYAVSIGNGTSHTETAIYTSLDKLNEDWEDVPEEPKEYWYIESDGSIIQNHKPTYINHLLDGLKSIGNYFGTREEAEKAVEKLKAWKRLKDKGFRFKHNKVIGEYGNVSYTLNYPANAVEEKDLDLLFGGEE